jgi:signal transduction histidine kinase
MRVPVWLLLFIFLMLANLSSQAQFINQLEPVRVDTARRYVSIMDRGQVTHLAPGHLDAASLLDTSLSFQPLKNNRLYHKKNACYDRLLIFRCRLVNPSDTSYSFRIFLGYYLKNTRVFKQVPGTNKIVEQFEQIQDPYMMRSVTLNPGEDCILYLVARSAKTSNLLYEPQLITEDYSHTFWDLMHYDKTGGTSISYIVTGILLLMIFFSFVSFLESYRNEFLYYCGFAFFLGLLFLLKAQDFHHLSYFAALEEEIFDFQLQLAGHLCFIFFTIQFLETKIKFPAIHKFLVAAAALLIVSFISFTCCYWLNMPYQWLALIENATKYALILLGIFFIVTGFIYYKDKLFRYLLMGNIAMLITGLISQWMSQYKLSTFGSFAFLSQSLFYYELGIVLELGFFLMGLVYKNFKELAEKVREQERLKAENERKELEKQFAVYTAQQEERNRISADMHDELGAGMTAIRLMSEIAISRSADQPLPEIVKISQTANDLVSKLNAIIWSISTSNDSVTNTISYIKKYAYDYFEGTDIKLTIDTPVSIEDKELSGEKRRNLFLSVKEALNNVLKHANATEVKIIFETNQHLSVIIEDNGRGMEEEKKHEFSNGLNNMKKRMKKTGGSFVLKSEKGVVITFSVPLS